MIEIYMKNVTSKIMNLNKYQTKMILSKLSYTENNFGQKPVTHYLLNVKTGITYTGLIPHAIEVLNKLNVKYIIHDQRVKPDASGAFKIQPPFAPRDYQKHIIDNITSREVIQAATGAGKTYIMSEIIAKRNVKPVVVIAPKVSLAMQIQEEFNKFLGEDIGLCGGGYKDIKDITICTPQSVPDQLKQTCKLLMYDECLKYNQKVLMEDGNYEEIGKLVEEKSTKKVLSYNHKLNKLEPKKIIGHSKTKLNNKKMMRIKIKKSNGEIEILECTNNHKIWIESLQKYVRAEDLKKGYAIKAII